MGKRGCKGQSFAILSKVIKMEDKDTYFVAVKLFLEDDGKLFIFKDKWGDWDLPGGRIKKDEFNAPLEEVVARKVKEELGEAVSYTLGKPEVLMRHERVEDDTGETARIFAVGYSAKYESGEVVLGEHHTEMKWVDKNEFKPEDYFTGGWLKGVKEWLGVR
ncbi:MAG: NUDIX domain-containing protein [Parcubacteria group bacterium]|nr:NUDIX domain-containing protein [Parcubacteria group bacterium]